MTGEGRPSYALGDEGLDVYRVGVLKDLWMIYRVARGNRRHLRRVLRSTWWSWTGLHSGHRCRAALLQGSSWNGYLAEPYHLPDGLRTIGHGWTKRRAVARLNRYVRRDCT